MALLRVAFGLLVLGLALSGVHQRGGAEPDSTPGTTRDSAVERVASSGEPLPDVPSFVEAAALKAVDEDSAAASVAASAGTRVDPMFRSCRDARMRGFGPYERGAHVEYYWYPDRDVDGTTCEPH